MKIECVKLTELEKLDQIEKIEGISREEKCGFTQEYLCNLFKHNLKTGDLICKVNLGWKYKKGIKAGCEYSHGSTSYLKITLKSPIYSKRITLEIHRIIYIIYAGFIPVNLMIDHENRNGLNNKLSNLRLVTRKVNKINACIYKNNQLKQKYITQLPNGKYRLRRYIDGKDIYMGCYITLLKAIKTRNKMLFDIGYFNLLPNYDVEHMLNLTLIESKCVEQPLF